MKILVLVFFLPVVAFSRSLSLQELVREAESYSPQIKAETFNLSASEAHVRQSKLVANPLFTFQGGSLKSGPQTGAVADFTLNQPLPWFGRRQRRIEAQEFLLKMSELTKEEVRLEVTHRVFQTGAELALLMELEHHYTERKRRFSLIEKSLISRPQVSPKQKVDRDLIESQINLLEKRMLDLQAKKETLKWELKILIGGKEFNKIIYSWDKLPEPLPKDNYLNLLDTSPKYRMLKVETKLAENKIEQARLEARPDIMVGMNYRQENVAPVNHFYHGQVTIVIPIIDYGQHSVDAAKAERRRTTAVHTVEKNHITSMVHQFYAEYEANKRAMDFFRLKNLHNIELKFYEAEKSFRKGYIDALTFLQIDSQVHENIDQIYLTRLSYLTSISNLNLLIGRGPEI